MKIYYFLIFLVFFCLTRTYKTKRKLKYNIKKIQKCEKIKCPPIDDPVCVKMNRNHTKDVYIIAINKCEIKYVNCHKDIEVAIVPMVNCLHVDKKYQNITRQRHKRDASEYKNDENFKDNEDEDSMTYPKTEEIKKEDDENEVKTSFKDQSEEIKKKDDEDEVKTSFKDQSEEIKKEDDENEVKTSFKDQSEEIKKKDDEDEVKTSFKDQSEENEGTNNAISKADNDLNENQSEIGVSKYNEEDDENIELNENDIPMVTLLANVGSDYEQVTAKVDLNENKENCPTVCPSRDVMVCAKCQHNIHRTFLSQCHLRKFVCEHPKEKLQLVKREPCVQSAPFISEINETKGRIPESGVDDKLHKFIFCRQKGLLNKDDPRCKGL